MPLAKETQLEIHLGALERNYRYLTSMLNPETKFMAVVKAFSYGHDAAVISIKLEALGVDYFAVAYAREGVVLREAGIKTPIMVLHPSPVNFRIIIDHCLEPSLYSPNILKSFIETATATGQEDYPVHLKFNTGLNRLGFKEAELGFIQEQIETGNAVKVISVLSHLAASDDPGERDFTEGQIQSFTRIYDKFFKALPYTPMKHLLNTSGIINYPQAQFDMVRSGIGLYGYGNEAATDAKLSPVATLKTVISQLHTINPGESIGYNKGFVSNTHKTTATLPLGHADGIGRQYGRGRGFVYVNGHKAFIVGNVCMDMIMVDVTGIECREGDEVIVFGKGASAETLAAEAGTISYELLSGISQRVKRLVIGD